MRPAYLRDKPGFGIYNVHMGFDPANADALAALLKTHGLHVDAEEVLTLDGFCKLRRELDATNWFPRQPHSSLPVILLKLALNPVLTLASVWKHTPPLGLRRSVNMAT